MTITNFEWISGQLAHEIINSDGYGLRTCGFEPDVIYDIGANIGWFSAWSRIVFPQAKVVAVEPYLPSLEYAKYCFQGMSWFNPVHAGIGTGPLKCALGMYGGHHRFLEGGSAPDNYTTTDVPCVMPAELNRQYGGCRQLWKIDCEGGEFAIFEHEPSLDVLRSAEYVCGELHGNVLDIPREVQMKKILVFLHKLAHTHSVEAHISKEQATFRARLLHRCTTISCGPEQEPNTGEPPPPINKDFKVVA